MKIRVAVAVYTAFMSSLCLLTASGQTSPKKSNSATNVTPASRKNYGKISDRVIGAWYMGTMTGFDCNLRVKADHTLTVQFGGCFTSAPSTTSSWRLSGNRMVLSNATLARQLGPYLSITRVGKNIVLVPQVNAATIKRFGYDYQCCFWKNLMGDKGLDLPKEARDFDKHRKQDASAVALFLNNH